MRAVVQRVQHASVVVGGETMSDIGTGLLVLLGVAASDSTAECDRLAAKIARLRIFEGADGRFDRSLVDVSGGALVISQFTLLADTRKGNRPSFSDAAPPEVAEPLYERFCDTLGAAGVHVGRGIFGGHMAVSLINDGPVTIVLDA